MMTAKAPPEVPKLDDVVRELRDLACQINVQVDKLILITEANEDGESRGE